MSRPTDKRQRSILTPDKVRRARARRLFRLGFDNSARGLTARTLDQYLVGVPPVPESLFGDDQKLFMLPLGDLRPGLIKSCGLIGIKYAEFGYNDDSVDPWDQRHCDPTEEPFWFRCDDGRPNRKRKPEDCRAECVGNHLAGTATMGIMAYAHFPNIVKAAEHVADLPGSVFCKNHTLCFYIGVWDDKPRLGLCRYDWSVDPLCGSMVARRYSHRKTKRQI